jgi:hypothetical protein
MAVSTAERLARVEEKQNDMSRRLGCIEDKLDEALKQKANQSQVDTISNRMWTFVILFATSFLGLLVYLIQSHLK